MARHPLRVGLLLLPLLLPPQLLASQATTAPLALPADTQARITSYNVCYTKLLRKAS